MSARPARGRRAGAVARPHPSIAFYAKQARRERERERERTGPAPAPAASAPPVGAAHGEALVDVVLAALEASRATSWIGGWSRVPAAPKAEFRKAVAYWLGRGDLTTALPLARRVLELLGRYRMHCVVYRAPGAFVIDPPERPAWLDDLHAFARLADRMPVPGQGFSPAQCAAAADLAATARRLAQQHETTFAQLVAEHPTLDARHYRTAGAATGARRDRAALVRQLGEVLPSDVPARAAVIAGLVALATDAPYSNEREREGLRKRVQSNLNQAEPPSVPRNS